jgi:predicted amidohydrolase YtcJ
MSEVSRRGTHPVFLDSNMAHAAWVSSEALRRDG